jgi:hypothetical protein
VNRWTTWAGDIRRRHGRRDRGRLSGSMVLVRPSLFRGPAATRRTSLHVHVNTAIAVSLLHPLLTVLRTRERRSMAPLQSGQWPLESRRLGAAPRQHSVDPVIPLVRNSPATFMKSRDAVTMRVRRHHTGLQPAAVAARERRSTVAVSAAPHLYVASAHAGLAQKLRRQTSREELLLPSKATVLARTMPAPAPAVSNEPAGHDIASPARVAWSASAPPTPALTVDALTSQVIQQLDRRLVAYRERMGRG